MLVEPESLCWPAGRLVPARDGATWAQEFARFPALRSVVRDDGTGLGRGLRQERDRRRAAGLPADRPNLVMGRQRPGRLGEVRRVLGRRAALRAAAG